MNAERFFGLTKKQFVVVVNLLVLLVVVGQAFVVYEVSQLANKGAQAHAAECAYKADLQDRAAEGEAFLKLTPAERVAKYGAALGSIPTTTIEQSLRNEHAAIASLSALGCNGH